MKPCLPKEFADALMVSSESAMIPLRKCVKAVSSNQEGLDSSGYNHEWNLYWSLYLSGVVQCQLKRTLSKIKQKATAIKIVIYYSYIVDKILTV